MHIFGKLFKSSRPRLTNYTIIRSAKRPTKPFWLGLARTKLFVIKDKKKLPPEEEAELVRLNAIYERQYNSVRDFQTKMSTFQFDQSKIYINDDMKKAEELFANWNKETALLRESRLKKQEEEDNIKLLAEIEAQNQNMKYIMEKVENIVKKEIELSPTFITKENLDEAVDKCLKSTSDYNYAIDLAGNVYMGLSKVPTGKIDENGVITEIVRKSDQKQKKLKGVDIENEDEGVDIEEDFSVEDKPREH